MIKKRDFIIIVSIFIVVSVIALVNYLIPFEGEAVVNVYIDGKLIDSFILDGEYRQVPIRTSYGYNLLILSENMAFIDEADCNLKSCVSRGVISRPGSIIICAPHHLVIKIETIKFYKGALQ